MEHIDSVVSKRFEVRSGRLCEFCKELDPQFLERRPFDQMVAANRPHTASAHLTEDGYVRHRMLELNQLVARRPLTAA
jgi:hypothetical protein